MKLVFNILSGGMLIVFAASCAVQYNDPDPGLWIVAYGVAGVFTAFALAGRLTPLTIPAGLIYLAWAMYNMPHVPSSEWLTTETSRESGGLMISAIWMAVLAIAWYRKRHPAPPQN
jgi:hypothetical protein